MLESLLYPKSVAIVGASRNPIKVGHAILKNIIDGGFEGRVIVINPNADEILGVKCYKSFFEYKEEIELSVIVVPTTMVKEAIQDSIGHGVKAICVITAGFKEIGAEGAKLQKEIANICKAANVRMLGPNVVGLINPHHKLNASFATRMPLPGNVAVISQSGAVCTILLDWAYGEGLGLANLISIGNKADLNEVDFLKISRMAINSSTQPRMQHTENLSLS
jgi:acyl-CoA synthetase (NDP forming)